MSVRRFLDPDLALHKAMLRTTANCQMILAAISKPADDSPDISVTDKASHAAHVRIGHQLLLRVKLARNVFVIGCIVDMDLFPAALRVLPAVDGIILPDDIIRNRLQDTRRIGGVFLCKMKSTVLRKMQVLDRVGKRPAVSPRLIADREQLLDILVEDRALQPVDHPVKCQIPLQLHQIQCSPCAEPRLLSAPVQEFLRGLFKRNAVPVQILHGETDHLLCLKVKPPVDLRFDQGPERIQVLFLLIQLDCADLNNLKRQLFIFIRLTRRALVPLKIKYNIIH